MLFLGKCLFSYDLYSHFTDIIVLRDLCIILLCYTALLRYSDMSELRCCDIHFMSDHIVVHVRKSKTDVYRAGRDIFVAKGCTSACAIAMLNRYIRAAGIDCFSENFYTPTTKCGGLYWIRFVASVGRSVSRSVGPSVRLQFVSSL